MSKSKVTKSPVKGAPQTPTMIHKHIDNFLAKIAGETPIDSNVRNSHEYWLNKIADVMAGKQKQLYEHNIGIYTAGESNVRFNIITDSSTPFTIDSLENYIKNLPGEHMINVYGIVTEDSGVTYIQNVYAILWAPSQAVFKFYYTNENGYSYITQYDLTTLFSTIMDQIRPL